MKELPSRGERYINHVIDFRATDTSKLATQGDWKNKCVTDAVYYDKLATDPDLCESLEESEDRGIPFTGTVYQLEAKNPQRDYEEKYAQDTSYPDSPIGDLPV